METLQYLSMQELVDKVELCEFECMAGPLANSIHWRELRGRLAEAEKLVRLAKIAESSWLVWSNEHGAWWRPDRCGYSADIGSAGRYSLVEAVSCCLTRSIENAMPPETILIAPESVQAYRDLRGDKTSSQKLREAGFKPISAPMRDRKGLPSDE